MASRLVAQALAEQSFTLESDVDYSDLEFASLSFESAAMELRINEMDTTLSLESNSKSLWQRFLAAVKSAWQKILQGLEKLWNWIRGNGWKLNKQLEDKVAKAPASTPEEKAKKDLASKVVESHKTVLKASEKLEEHKKRQAENLELLNEMEAMVDSLLADQAATKDLEAFTKYMTSSNDTKTPKAIADAISAGKTVVDNALSGDADAGNVESYSKAVADVTKLADAWGAKLKIDHEALKKAKSGKIEIPEKKSIDDEIKAAMDLLNQAKSK